MTRFSEIQILKILREYESGKETKDLCRHKPPPSPTKRCTRKKVLRPSERRDGTEYLIEEHDDSTQRACRVVGLPRSMRYYKTKKDASKVIFHINLFSFRLEIKNLSHLLLTFLWHKNVTF